MTGSEVSYDRSGHHLPSKTPEEKHQMAQEWVRRNEGRVRIIISGNLLNDMVSLVPQIDPPGITAEQMLQLTIEYLVAVGLNHIQKK